ncbi:DUF2637 domain-containing protein [Plantactinospora sp. CA-290183]|uniref:DUF2637 domain-containing protein n=1 Tax=Plantactinospora sp. CA-290183 TaxID=3240006 RepID=UPI003D8E64FC
MNDLRQLKRIRAMVRVVLMLGVAASVAGNVLHARDSLISQVISAWAPLALLLTVDLVSRVPVHTKGRAYTRWAATAVIAGIAAWVSYWHMAAVASKYGETGGSQYLLPLSVDGLIVVASICLVELGGRISAVTLPAGDQATEAASTDQPFPVMPVVTPATVAAWSSASEPAKRRAKRTTPRSLTNAEKVAKVAAKMPDATNAEVAKAAGVSERTVVRHRPKLPTVAEAAANLGADPAVVADLYADRGYDTDGTPTAPPSGLDAAETPVNGQPVDLAEVSR